MVTMQGPGASSFICTRYIIFASLNCISANASVNIVDFGYASYYEYFLAQTGSYNKAFHLHFQLMCYVLINTTLENIRAK